MKLYKQYLTWLVPKPALGHILHLVRLASRWVEPQTVGWTSNGHLPLLALSIVPTHTVLIIHTHTISISLIIKHNHHNQSSQMLCPTDKSHRKSATLASSQSLMLLLQLNS